MTIITSKENLALDLIFGLLREERNNRSMSEYMRIAARTPKLEALVRDANKILGNMAAANFAPFEICYFKAGDRYPWYEPFPDRLSRETFRSAWVKSGMRELQIEAKRRRTKSKRTH